MSDMQHVMNCAVCSQSHLQLRSARPCDATTQRQPPLATCTGADLVQAVFDGVQGLAPSYITELCVPVALIRPRSSLRSAAHGTSGTQQACFRPRSPSCLEQSP